MPNQLSNPDITVLQICGVCRNEIGSFTVKLDNLLLLTKEKIWCPKCQADQPELREVAGRRDAVAKEQASYPRNVPASPVLPSHEHGRG